MSAEVSFVRVRIVILAVEDAWRAEFIESAFECRAETTVVYGDSGRRAGVGQCATLAIEKKHGRAGLCCKVERRNRV